MSGDWASHLNRIVDKGGRDLGKLARAFKIELFSGTISDTRVGQPSAWKNPAPAGYVGGRLRGNWQIQETIKPEGVVDQIDPIGAVTTSRVEQSASEDGITYFVNNLPYAHKWEQADAMMGRNLVRVKANVKRMAESL